MNDVRKVDWINVGLILLALGLAFLVPLPLFLFSYAVLGPLHYMTEINWLDERKYFSKSGATPWVLGTFVLLVCLGSFYNEGASNPALSGFRQGLETAISKGVAHWLVQNMVHLMFLSLVAGVAFAAFKGWALRVFVMFLGVLVALAFSRSSVYSIVVGAMLPTIIHVSLFTGIFMLYGALKSDSRPGFIAFVVFILAHLAILWWPLTSSNYQLAEASSVAKGFQGSGFHMVVFYLGQLMGGGTDQPTLYWRSDAGIRLCIFLSFSYTYHYLNWFSKTGVIRWHHVSRRKLIAAVLIWLGAVALYAYDYRTGLLALLFLSFLHVVFEFPLNYVSVSGAIGALKTKFAFLKN